MTYLLDTNVLSESVAPKANPVVIEWLQKTLVSECYISALTIGEIKRGIEKLPDIHPRKRQLGRWLEDEVMARFLGRIVAVDAAVMLEWGKLTASLERLERALPLMDSLLAAQAFHYQLTLVTRNERDFQGIGIVVVNPWA